jgi:hypothetical protein
MAGHVEFLDDPLPEPLAAASRESSPRGIVGVAIWKNGFNLGHVFGFFHRADRALLRR